MPGHSETFTAITTDPSHVTHLAVAWPQAYGANSSRTLLRCSFDGGVHWSPQIDVARVAAGWTPVRRLARPAAYRGGSWSDDYQEWVQALNPSAHGGFRLGRTVHFTDGP